MSENPVLPASPTKEVTTTTNNSNAKRFEGDGIVFKGKLIGMEDLSIDRDEKVCLDSMFKLKAVARARGEHKQKLQINLTMSAIRLIDDTTKAQIASHEIERISFVVVDPRDSRAFGYIFNTSADRHQFWAIKTERPAAVTVLALKELFELAFEQFTNTEKAKLEANKSTTTPVTSPPVSPMNELVSTQEPSSSILDSTIPSVVPTTTSFLLDDNLLVATTPTTTKQTTGPVEGDLWDINAPPIPVIPPTPKVIDPLEDFFNGFSTTQPPASTNTGNLLLNLLPNAAPLPVNPFVSVSPPTANVHRLNATPPPVNPFATISPPTADVHRLNATPPPINPYVSFPPPTTDAKYLNTTPSLPQQQPYTNRIAPPPPPPPQYRQRQGSLDSNPLSPVTPPSVNNPFTGFDIFGGLTPASTTKTTKESFFPPGPPPKTIQQLKMEKQS